MRSRAAQFGLYRADITSPERLRATTVAREHVLQDTLETLRASASKKSKHHMLFIGPRGIGKTHLLSLIKDGIAQDEELAASYAVARFPEESNRTRSFADFLIGLCEALKDALPDEELWAQLFEKVETEANDDTVIDTVVSAVRADNRERGRTLLVMLENLGEMFSHQIRDKQDLAAMRKFFMGHNGCLLLATAPLHFDAITNVDEPFYDFFDIQILDQLSFEQTVELIRKNLKFEKFDDILADFEAMRPKLRALYQMTGGSPRLTMMLYELIAHDSVTEVQKQFHLLLDRITPFYQDRLNDLPPAQRALLECMASMRDREKTPASIAAKMRITQPETSSLLKRLTDARYLRSFPHPKDKRSRLYTIREGFFDIWLAMNLSRSDRRRLPFLLEFFNTFYPQIEEREKKRADLKTKLSLEDDGDALHALDYLSEVGSADERTGAKLDIVRYHAQAGDFNQSVGLLREAAELSGDGMGRSIVRLSEAAGPGDYLSDLQAMIECWDLHRSGDFETFANRLTELSGSLTPLAYSETKLAFLKENLEQLTDPESRIFVQLKIGQVLTGLARWDEAEPLLRNAVGEAERSGSDSVHSIAMNDLALLLHATNRLDEAEPLMRQALDIDRATLGDEHPAVAIRMSNLARLLQDTNRLDDAEPLMRQALDIGRASLGDEHPTIALRLNNLAQLLEITGRLDEAEPLMRHALDIDRASFGDEHPKVARDLNNLAPLLHARGRTDEAESLMRQTLDIVRASFGDKHPKVAIALSNLAWLLHATNRLEEAESTLREALDIDRASFGDVHPDVARDLNNLARLLQDNSRLDEAEPLMLEALCIFLEFGRKTGHRHPHTDDMVRNVEALLREMGRDEESIKAAISDL